MRVADEKAPENETEEQLRARMQRKARKMMFNPDGVAYAPWVSKQINEDVRVANAHATFGLMFAFPCSPPSSPFSSHTHSHF